MLSRYMYISGFGGNGCRRICRRMLGYICSIIRAAQSDGALGQTDAGRNLFAIKIPTSTSTARRRTAESLLR